MAKLNTKNMTSAELKSLKSDLTASRKTLLAQTKEVVGKIGDASKVLAAARKTHEAAVAAAHKAAGAAIKEANKVLDAAGKADIATTKSLGKDKTKLDVQLAAHDAKLVQVAEALEQLKAPVGEPAEA